MIRPRQFIEKFERDGQPYDTRLNRMRLAFNEYVNHIDTDLINKILRDLDGERLSAYPEVNQAYEILANYYNVEIENILLGHGSDSVLFNVISTFCDEGDAIASILPTYGMYKVYANMLNCRFITAEYNMDREISSNQLDYLIKQNPKVIVIANPNGVIGTKIDDTRIIDFIIKAKERDILVIIDEAYAEFSKKTMLDHVKDHNNLVVIRSCSKSLGMAGVRIGYGIMDKNIRKYAYKMKPVVEVNTLAVSAIKVLFKEKEIKNRLISKIIESKIYTTDQLRKLGYEVLDTETNFLLVSFNEKETKVIEKLKDRKVELKKLNNVYGNYYRITVGTIDVMERFIKYLNEVE